MNAKPIRMSTKRASTHPHPDESLRLRAGVCQAVTVTVAAAQRILQGQSERVGLATVAVVSHHIFLKERIKKRHARIDGNLRQVTNGKIKSNQIKMNLAAALPSSIGAGANSSLKVTSLRFRSGDVTLAWGALSGRSQRLKWKYRFAFHDNSRSRIRFFFFSVRWEHHLAYLRKVSVAQLTFVAFLSSEGVTASAAARVDVALLIHRTHRTTAALLRNGNHIFTQMGVDKKWMARYVSNFQMSVSDTLHPVTISWPQWLGAQRSHLSPSVFGGQIHCPVLASQLLPTWLQWHAETEPGRNISSPKRFK